jgi:hypothetical protein
VLAAVSKDGRALQYAAKTLQSDREIVLAAVSESGWALQYAAKTLQSDREIVLAAVSESGQLLRFLSSHDLRKPLVRMSRRATFWACS